MNRSSAKKLIKSERHMSLKNIILPKLKEPSKQQYSQPKNNNLKVQLIKTRTLTIGNLRKLKLKFQPQQYKAKRETLQELNIMYAIPDTERKQYYQIESSNDSKQIMQQLINDEKEDQRREAEIFLFKKNLNRKGLSESKYTSQKLVGQDAIKKFYDRYKNMEKVFQKQQYYGLENPITLILSILDIYNIPPKKMQIIKLKGSDAILDLRNCGLGKGSGSRIVSQIVTKIDNFQQIDLSFNDINQDIVDLLIPNLKTVEKINISHNKIGKIGTILFSNNFRSKMCNIKCLNLQSNQISQASGLGLIDSMMEYRRLRILNLSKNFIGNQCAAKLRKYLLQDKCLYQLYLHWNQITQKGGRNIFEAIKKNQALKVLDISWNSLSGNMETVQTIANCTDLFIIVFKQNTELIHLDMSFCELNVEQTEILSAALQDNHTIYGLHYEGNLGYIDYRGGLNFNKQQKKVVQYPIPIKRGILRRINGINSSHQVNQFKENHEKDICWICQGWQEVKFMAHKPPNFDGECFLYLSAENYKPLLMQLTQDQYQLKRMCPLGQNKFYFTIGPSDIIHISKFYQRSDQILDLINTQPNIFRNQFKQEIFTDKYETDTNCYPRPEVQVKKLSPQIRQLQVNQKVVKMTRIVEIKKKKKVLKEQKMNYMLREIKPFDPVNSPLARPNRDEKNFYKKCIQFDINNSKIFKVIRKQDDQLEFKQLMQQHYGVFKIVYYYLSNNNVNPLNMYSVPDYNIQQFVYEQKYQSKRVTMAKIMLKLYACITINQSEKGQKDKQTTRLVNRPQFLQFLVRLAQQKWATFVPSKKKEAKDEDKDKIVKQQQNQEQQQSPTKQIIPLPMPLIKAIQRLIKTLYRYVDRINPQYFRVRYYLTYQCQIIYKAYQSFLQELYDKYAGSRLVRATKVSAKYMIADEFKDLLSISGIKKTRQGLKDCEDCFMNAKNLQYEDGLKPPALDFFQFLEALARYSQKIFIAPINTENQKIWANEELRKKVPMFLKYQALIALLYKCSPELQSKNMSRIVENGLYSDQVPALVELLRGMDIDQSSKFRRTAFKLNSLFDMEQISLKTLVDYLDDKYRNKTVIREELVDLIEYKNEQYEIKI